MLSRAQSQALLILRGERELCSSWTCHPARGPSPARFQYADSPETAEGTRSAREADFISDMATRTPTPRDTRVNGMAKVDF